MCDDKNLGASFDIGGRGGGDDQKCLDSMHFLRMRTPQICKFFPHMLQCTSFRENSASVPERGKALRILQKNERIYRRGSS